MNNKCIYYVEGPCEQQLIAALKETPARLIPGKVKVFNVVQNLIPKSQIWRSSMERQSFVFILQKSVLKFLTLPLLVSSIAVRTSVHRTNSSSKFRTCGRKMIFSFPQYRVRSSKFFFRFDVCDTSVSNTKTTVVPA